MTVEKQGQRGRPPKEAVKKNKTREELLAERRMQRKDIGKGRDVLKVPTDPLYVYRWFNDVPMSGGVNRIQWAMSKGWEVANADQHELADESVKDDNVSLGSVGKRPVGKDSYGNPLYAVLLRMSKELWDIDQEIKDEPIKELEDQIHRRPKSTGMYGEVKIGGES